MRQYVFTPTGEEIAPEGWDEDDTVIMTKEELQDLLSTARPALSVACSVAERKGSRPALRVDITER